MIGRPARSLRSMSTPADSRKPLNQRRLPLLLPFATAVRRRTGSLVATRGRVVGALGDVSRRSTASLLAGGGRLHESFRPGQSGVRGAVPGICEAVWAEVRERRACGCAVALQIRYQRTIRGWWPLRPAGLLTVVAISTGARQFSVCSSWETRTGGHKPADCLPSRLAPSEHGRF